MIFKDVYVNPDNNYTIKASDYGTGLNGQKLAATMFCGSDTEDILLRGDYPIDNTPRNPNNAKGLSLKNLVILRNGGGGMQGVDVINKLIEKYKANNPNETENSAGSFVVDPVVGKHFVLDLGFYAPQSVVNTPLGGSGGYTPWTTPAIPNVVQNTAQNTVNKVQTARQNVASNTTNTLANTGTGTNVNTNTGSSTAASTFPVWAWVLIHVVGLGAIGFGIWYFGFKNKGKGK